MAYIDRASGYPDFNSNAGNPTGFIPQLFESKFIERLYEQALVTDLGTTKYNGMIKNKGDSVVIPTKPVMQIDDYEIGTDLTEQVPRSDAVILTISEAKSFFAVVDDIDEYESIVDIMKVYAEAGAIDMATKIDTEVFTWLGDELLCDPKNTGTAAGAKSGSYNIGNSTTPVIVDSSNALQLVLMCNAVMDEQNIPRNSRWMTLPAAFAYNLKDSDLKSVCITGDSKSPLRMNDRAVGDIDGTRIYVSNNLRVDGGTFFIPFGDQDTFAFCSQMTKTSFGELEKRFASYIKGLNVYGYELLDPKRLGVMVATF